MCIGPLCARSNVSCSDSHRGRVRRIAVRSEDEANRRRASKDASETDMEGEIVQTGNDRGDTALTMGSERERKWDAPKLRPTPHSLYIRIDQHSQAAATRIVH